MAKKLYIGDSVYVEQNEFGGLTLTTNNGHGPTNTIVLEPPVLESFVRSIHIKLIKKGVPPGETRGIVYHLCERRGLGYEYFFQLL